MHFCNAIFLDGELGSLSFTRKVETIFIFSVTGAERSSMIVKLDQVPGQPANARTLL